MPTVPNGTDLLLSHLRHKLREGGLNPDVYDPDFIYGIFIMWLGENDALLTSRGVEKVSDFR